MGKAQQERGQGLVEYALLIVLISLVVLVIFSLFGPSIKNVYAEIYVTFKLQDKYVTLCSGNTGDPIYYNEGLDDISLSVIDSIDSRFYCK